MNIPQRTFGTTAQPFKRESVSSRKSSKPDPLGKENLRENQRIANIDKKDEEESTMYQTLRDAVDVLTRWEEFDISGLMQLSQVVVGLHVPGT